MPESMHDGYNEEENVWTSNDDDTRISLGSKLRVRIIGISFDGTKMVNISF